jgi:hypothetical protein
MNLKGRILRMQEKTRELRGLLNKRYPTDTTLSWEMEQMEEELARIAATMEEVQNG